MVVVVEEPLRPSARYRTGSDHVLAGRRDIQFVRRVTKRAQNLGYVLVGK